MIFHLCRSCPPSTTDNYVHDNGDAGMALMESFNADVSNNVLEDSKHGVRLPVGCADSIFSKNGITGSSK